LRLRVAIGMVVAVSCLDVVVLIDKGENGIATVGCRKSCRLSWLYLLQRQERAFVLGAR
jgi:hypothetical protein